MDGYTVEETASVLGVPRERVWELIARGVLSAAPDLGGAMRVRLRADGPQAPQRAQNDLPAAETPPAPGGQSLGDPSPFRELLTEFRGLTERYGQALLALGEARGEVAGLRARVELLEARVDLRLAGGTSAPADSWSAPQPAPAERVVPQEQREPAPAAQREADDGESDDERAAQRRRGKGGRRATEAFAEALARAEDPSAPELPGARDAAAAWAALRDAPHAGEAGTDAALPRELPAADDVPVAEEEPPPDVTAEPDAGTAREAAPEESPEEPGEELPQQPAAETVPETAAEPARAAASDGKADEPVDSKPAALPAGEAADRQPAQSTPPAAEAQPEVQRVDDRYTTEIEEPGWFTAEELGLEPASEPASATDPAARAEPSIAWPQAEAAPSADVRARNSSAQESGSRQLDEGLAGLDALAHPERTEATAGERDAGLDPSSEAQPPAADCGEPGAAQPLESSGPQPPVAPWSRPAPERASSGSIRAGSRAYRRLRRIFPD